MLGAIAALVGGTTPGSASPPGGKEPFRPAASVAKSPSRPQIEPTAARPNPSADAPSAPTETAPSGSTLATPPPGAVIATGPGVWYREPFTVTPDSLEAAEVACGRGEPDACMRAGLAYLDGKGTERNETRGKLLLTEGRKRYLVACQNGDPAACLGLSRIYADGIATFANPANARALRGRARQLCQDQPSPVCTGLR